MHEDVIADAIQRAGVFAELPGVLAGLGVDVAACFEGTGIDPASLQASDRVPFARVLETLDRAAQLSACPHIGLLVGSRFRLAHHGLLGRLMASAPTLGQALTDFVIWQAGFSSGAVVYQLRQGEDAALGYGTLAAGAPGSRQIYDSVIAIGLCKVRELTGGRAGPTEAFLSFQRPPDVTAYARILKLRVRFDQPHTCLLFDRAALDFRLPGADPDLRRRLQAEIEAAARVVHFDMSAQVRGALRRMMPLGATEMSMVSAKVGLHPRTLRRRLAAEGQTFSDLRDEVRYALAREFLAMTRLPVGDIAAAVGLAAPGTFSESFRRWSGMSPTAWRASGRTPGAR